MKYGIDTRCQHLADDNKDEIYGAISYPIYQSATFARDRVGGGSGYDYSRLQNPTREHLEKIVASLEEGIDALAFSTGMAAITALMEIFKPGDHIIIDEDLYGGSVRLFHSINVKNGLTFTSVDLSSVDVEDYIQDNTKAIYAFGVGNQGIYQFQNVFFAADIGKWIVTHGFLKVYRVQHLYPIPAAL